MHAHSVYVFMHTHICWVYVCMRTHIVYVCMYAHTHRRSEELRLSVRGVAFVCTHNSWPRNCVCMYIIKLYHYNIFFLNAHIGWARSWYRVWLPLTTHPVSISVKRDLVWRQKRPSTEAKETWYRGKTCQQKPSVPPARWWFLSLR